VTQARELDSPVALQHFGRGLRLVERRVVQRRLALEIPCVDIRALSMSISAMAAWFACTAAWSGVVPQCSF